MRYTDSKIFLDKIVDVMIDRPLGFKHQEFDTYYPVNYGFIPGTIARDGEELDA